MIYKTRRRIGSLVIFGVVVYMVVALTRNLIDFSGSDSRVAEIEKKVAVVREENQRLKRVAERVDTQEFEELMIKEKLGLVKPGEMVAILPQDYVEENMRGGEDDLEAEVAERSNWEKWWKLFW